MRARIKNQNGALRTADSITSVTLEKNQASRKSKNKAEKQSKQRADQAGSSSSRKQSMQKFGIGIQPSICCFARGARRMSPHTFSFTFPLLITSLRLSLQRHPMRGSGCE
jgi:hypothetical protein